MTEATYYISRDFRKLATGLLCPSAFANVAVADEDITSLRNVPSLEEFGRPDEFYMFYYLAISLGLVYLCLWGFRRKRFLRQREPLGQLGS